jgi:hypothetical protein
MAPAPRRQIVTAVAADVVAVLVFVALGRRSHDEGGNVVVETAKVAAPFLIALALGWAAARAWRAPRAMVTGLVVWVVTVVAGMLLRRFVFDRGTATSFIVVATLVTGALLLGWRAAARAGSRRVSGP